MLHQLGKNIFLVSPPVRPSYPYGNCLYIQGNDPILIDTGAGTDALAEVKPAAVSRVLLTHSHIDHTHSTISFSTADILIGQKEEPYYNDEQLFLRHNGFRTWQDILHLANIIGFKTGTPPFGDVPIMDEFRHRPLKATFHDLEQWECGPHRLTALHLPGHTSGHFGFYIEKEGLLMSGDIDLVDKGPWMGSDDADIDDLIWSVERIKEVDPRIIVPSHRRVQQDNLRRQLDAFVGVILERQESLLQLLKVPHSLEELVPFCQLYPRPRPDYVTDWEVTTLSHHLDFGTRHGLLSEVSPGIYERV